MVNGMHHRHPAVTANMAATLDHISGGRFELGMGAGWNVMESEAYGIELGSLKERSDRLDEGLEVIVSLSNGRGTAGAAGSSDQLKSYSLSGLVTNTL
jgi:alkanesulfonate monooxygenase SsuD/methylene tetrahydromethanopterin reductase-like flavin-dependent oxidoreductase (luciferase family)